MFRMILFIVLFACASVVNAEEARDRRPYKIVATTGMIADIVSRISGARAEVQGLISSGVDPHLYKATRSDIAALMGADIVFYNGLLLEGQMIDALIKVATSGKPVFAVTELIDQKDLLEPVEFAGHYDPHVWMDPVSWAKSAQVVEEKLSGFDPAGRSSYASNLKVVLEDLKKLDDYGKMVLGSVPEASRVLVSAHDAFNYFGRRYHFEVVGIQGISTESEAGVLDIERIVKLLIERKIPAVFVESTVSDRNIRALIEGARAKSHTVQIGGQLFSDAMGKPGTYEGTYVGMIDHNLTTIARSLGGKPPLRGMSGMLAISEEAVLSGKN